MAQQQAISIGNYPGKQTIIYSTKKEKKWSNSVNNNFSRIKILFSGGPTFNELLIVHQDGSVFFLIWQNIYERNLPHDNLSLIPKLTKVKRLFLLQPSLLGTLSPPHHLCA